MDMKASPDRIQKLWQFSRDSECRSMPHVKKVWDVPHYGKDTSRFPWLHLLTQTSLSVGFAWNDWHGGAENGILIGGSIWGGHRTLRSIHVGLPRSLPRSFSILDGPEKEAASSVPPTNGPPAGLARLNMGWAGRRCLVGCSPASIYVCAYVRWGLLHIIA